MTIDYHFIKIGGQDVLSPRELSDAAAEQGFPAGFWGKANSIHVPIGFEPGTAYIVVPRTSMDNLNVNGLHSIVWTMNRAGTTHTNTYNYWTICDARAVGIDGDSKAAYLLTLRDLRCRMKKAKVINKAYNVSTPDQYGTVLSSRRWLEDTLKAITYPTAGFALWTWQEMLADVWADLPTIAGTVPTLPWTPDHSPDTWRFHGICAWEAVRMIFDACQSSIKPVATLDSFEAVDLGTAQADVFSGLTGRLLQDERPKDPEACVFPAKVTITFPTRAQTAGAIEHYAELPVYAADPIATGMAGAVTGSELPVRYDLIGDTDDTGTILNEAALDAAAIDIAARIANRMYVASDMYKMHSGVCHEVVLGTNTNEIIVRDYGDDTGCVTESIGHLRTGLPTEAWNKPVREFTGSGTQVIGFKILRVAPFNGETSAAHCLAVIAEVTDVGCGGAGVSVGRQVIVWDVDACQFNVPIDILINARGTAVKMAWNENEGPSECEEIVGYSYGYLDEGQCWWKVLTLCCIEDWYDYSASNL